MGQRVTRQRVPECRRPGRYRGNKALRQQEGPGNLDKGALFHHHFGIQGAHGLVVEIAGERGQRGLDAGIQIGPHQGRRQVVGKEPEIVLQHLEVIPEQVAIRGVGVGDIDVALKQRKVREAVIDAACGLGQAISLLQAGPAVGAVAELVAEPETKLRERGQVGNPLQAEARRGLAGHGNGVGIVEAEAREQFRPEGGKPGIQFCFVQFPFHFQNGLPKGAGVLGVGVDLA